MVILNQRMNQKGKEFHSKEEKQNRENSII
jgi:hypothetical protein